MGRADNSHCLFLLMPIYFYFDTCTNIFVLMPINLFLDPVADVLSNLKLGAPVHELAASSAPRITNGEALRTSVISKDIASTGISRIGTGFTGFAKKRHLGILAFGSYGMKAANVYLGFDMVFNWTLNKIWNLDLADHTLVDSIIILE